jgi:hypothetical protein
MMSEFTLDARELSDHTVFLGRLARTLVLDDEQADDVVLGGG